MTLSVIVGITGAVFILDILSPLQLPWATLYLVPLALMSAVPNRNAPVLFAASATGLVLVSHVLTSAGQPAGPPQFGDKNSLFAAAAVWTGLLLLRFFQPSPPPPARADAQQEEEHRQLRHLFGERVKELSALHRTVRLLQDSAKPVEEALSQIVALLPLAWQYPDNTAARIQFGDIIVATPSFTESPWKQTASWATTDGSKGMIEVIYRETRPHETEGPFLAEERDLINSLADSLSSYLNRRHAEQALHAANERLQALSQQLMDVQENERRRLALDLHDEIGQSLTIVKMNLQRLQRTDNALDIAVLLKDCSTVIDQTLQYARNLSLELRPSLLDDLGLVPAVRWYLSRQAERAGWKLQVQADEELSPPQHVAVACFRVLQEAVTNIMRHSKATVVTVSLSQQNGDLLLAICDDGIGFDVRRTFDDATSGHSMGLLGMQERVRVLNGTLSIDSHPGQGSEVRIRIPLPPVPSSSQTEASQSL